MAKLEGGLGGQTKDRRERLHKNSKVGGRGTEGRKGRGVWKRWGESKKEQLKTVRTEDKLVHSESRTSWNVAERDIKDLKYSTKVQ